MLSSILKTVSLSWIFQVCLISFMLKNKEMPSIIFLFPTGKDKVRFVVNKMLHHFLIYPNSMCEYSGPHLPAAIS